VHLNYTKINIYSAQPIYQGSSSEIFGKNANNTMKELGRKGYGV
jgi:chromosome segregation and condensation protein ScpB